MQYNFCQSIQKKDQPHLYFNVPNSKQVSLLKCTREGKTKEEGKNPTHDEIMAEQVASLASYSRLLNFLYIVLFLPFILVDEGDPCPQPRRTDMYFCL